MRIAKDDLKEWCEQNLHTHTDWTGTYVETKDKCDSVEKLVDKLWNYLEDKEA